jgi:nucleoporin NUP82
MNQALQQSRTSTRVRDTIPPSQRVDALKGLQQQLKREAEETLKSAKEEHQQQQQQQQRSGMVKVPTVSRKLENEQVERLLERETALVEAATQRLRSLGISMPAGAGP